MPDTDLIDLWQLFLTMLLRGPALVAQADAATGMIGILTLALFYTSLASPFLVLWSLWYPRWRARHPRPVPPLTIDPNDRFLQDVEAYMSARYPSPARGPCNQKQGDHDA
jgi:hypothetical protein